MNEKVSVIAAGFLALAVTGVAIAETCYHLQRNGGACGSGATFCTVNTEVCDDGWQSGTMYGCGRLGPMDEDTVERNCYKITGSTTAPCDPGMNGPPFPAGCRNGNVCCFAYLELTRRIEASWMQTPMGASCECGPGGS